MALKLPTIQRRAVQDLAKQDPYGPVRVANARADALAQFSRAGEAAASLMKMYSDREKQEQLRDAMLAVHTADSEFRKTYGGQEEYDPETVDNESLMELMKDATGPVPAHQVYAEGRTKNYQKAMKDAALRISDPRIRDNFTADQEMSRMSFYAEDSERAAKDQIQYVTKRDIRLMEEALLTKDYGGARLIMATSTAPSDVRDRGLFDIDKREQVDYFNEIIEGRNLSVMRAAYDQLQKNDPRRTSNLNTEEHKQTARELRIAIDQEEDAIKAGMEANLKLYKDDLRNQIKDMWDGRRTNSERMRKNISMLESSDPVLAQEARWTMELQPKVNEVLRLDPKNRTSALLELSKISNTPKQEYFVRQLETAIEDTERQLKTDAVKWGIDTHFTAVKPLDMSNPSRMGVQFKERLPSIVALQDRQKAFTGFGTNAEMDAFGTYFENASTKDQMAIIGSISRELKEWAPPLFEQLKNRGVTKTAAIAGQLYYERPQVSKMILDGSRIRKENPVVQKEIQDARLDRVMAEKFGYLFAGNPTHQALMGEAFKDVWAVTKDTDKAFDLLVGETITLGEGSVIKSPAPGMSSWGYRRALEDLPDSYWQSPEMKVHGYAPKDLKRGILDGSLKQVGAENGAAILIAPNGNVVTLPDGRTPFKFKPDFTQKRPKSSTMFQEGMKKEDLGMGVLKRRPEDIALEKQKRAEEYAKRNAKKTEQDYEMQGRQGTPGFTILKGMTP